MSIQKPILKWVGGKSQILENILEQFPEEINNYHEIFLGGGSVLLGVLSSIGKDIKIKGKIFAYDLNKDLINVYLCIQKNPEQLYKSLDGLLEVYDSLTGKEVNRNPQTIDEAKTSQESYYYWNRKTFNTMDKIKNPIESAALFIFLNKTCFRGLYREGPNGFNVPFGHYKTTPKIKKSEIQAISELIQPVQFINCSFEESLLKATRDDFVYLDPPYAPEGDKSFVGYTADGFNLDMHKKLFFMIDELHKRQVLFMMSNSNVPMVRENFDKYNVETIKARRAINSKNPGASTKEVIITNY